MSELKRWLKVSGLHQYADLLSENKIDLDILADLTTEDLAGIGIPLGDCKRILRAIATDHGMKHPADSEHPYGTTGEPQLTSWNTDRGMRRQLTVMFVDLVGSTKLSQQFDVEIFTNLIRLFHNVCSKIIREHNGWVAQYLGDGQLTYFGYPKAGEEDPELAVLAGLSIGRSVPKIETGVGVVLQARIGIATGLVVIGVERDTAVAEQGAVWGDAVNLGARLQGIAGPGEVVISDDTHKIIGNQFDCEDLGLQTLKGFSKKIRAWRIRGATAAISRFDAHHRDPLTSFVGRDEEIALLGRRWGRAREGEGQVVLISGEPGIGKSRLTQALMEQTKEDPLTRIICQCSPHHTDSAYYPILMHLEHAAKFATGDTPDQKLDKLELLLGRSTTNLSATVPLFASLLKVPYEDRYSPLQLSPKETKEKVLLALMEQLVSLARNEPIMLLFEDIQWIDPTSQEFLDMLITRISGYPVLLLCTFRPEYASPWVGLALVTTLHLNRLERSQAELIVQGLSGDRALPPHLTEEIIEKTDGVPLFLEELTKAVLESDALQRSDRPDDLLELPKTWAMPATLKDSLMARLDRMAGVREVAAIGAAIGRTFDYALLATVAEIPDDDLQDILDMLIDSQLLYRRGRPPDAAYTFKHSLVQDTAYESLLFSTRQKLHLRIAKAIKAFTNDADERKPELLALHFYRGKAYKEACKYWWKAAILSSQASANFEAITNIKRAIGANAKSGDNNKVTNEIELRELMYVAQEATMWGSAEIADNLEQLRALKESRGETEKLLSVLHGLSGCHLIAARVSDARILADRIFEVNNDNEKDVATVLGNRLLGICDFLSAEFENSVSHFENTIAMSRHIDQDVMRKYYHANNLLVSQSMMSWALVFLGGADQAADSLELSENMVQTEKDVYSQVYSLNVLASAFQSAGDPEKSLNLAIKALELSKMHKIRYWEAWAQIMVGWGNAALGRQHQGIHEMKAGIEKYQATGSLQLLPYAWTLLADAFCRVDKTTDGLRTIEQFENNHDFEEIRYVDTLVADLRNHYRILSPS